MKTAAVTVALVLFSSACTAQTKRAGLVGGGVLTAGGAVIAMSAMMTDCSSLHQDSTWGNGTGCDIGSGLRGGVGLMAVAAGVAILIAAAAAPDAENTRVIGATHAPGIDASTVAYTQNLPAPAPQTADPMLRNFTQQASMAARTGQCLAVRAIAVRVEDLDRQYRYTGFVRDPLVVACLN